MQLQKHFTKMALLGIFMLLLTAVVGAQEPVEIRWFVGLGAGTDAPLIAGQQAIVDEFNASQSDIKLTLEVVDNAQAFDVLATQIAAGNAPDIVGPMGVRGRESFPGVWLDLSSLIESNSYDLSDFDPALIEFYRVPGEGQLGIPFAVFPSFTLYNKDLFDEAGVPYPPAAYGDPYIDWDGNEREWNMDTIRDLAMILTVDANGNDATMEEFDPENIVQFGWGNQMTDLRGRDTMFGAGNFVDADGNAVIPEQWRDAEKWYHQAMWEDYFYPNGVYGTSELLGASSGNWFDTGNLAMTSTPHFWYIGWGTGNLTDAWDFAPVPSYNGTTTAKLHADTFSIMKSTKNPEAAFEVLTYLVGERVEDLNTLYGGLPARLSLQENYLDTLKAKLANDYPSVDWENLNWDVAVAGMSYPDNPNHEDGMPSFLESSARYIQYAQLVDNNADVDIDAELDLLQADLQAIYDAAK